MGVGQQKFDEAMSAYKFLKRIAETFPDNKRNFLIEIANLALDEAGEAWMNDDYWKVEEPA